MDCGPACLKMITKYYGKNYSLTSLRTLTGFNRQGVSMLSISQAAEQLGLRTRGIKPTFRQLEEVKLPAILHWDQGHFVVLVSLKGKQGARGVVIADPGKGMMHYTKKEFLSHWIASEYKMDEDFGIALTLEPSPAFYHTEDEQVGKTNWKKYIEYLKPNKGALIRVFLSLFLVSLIQFVFPFLSEIMVDKGIGIRDLNTITVVLIAQIVLALSLTLISFIQSRIMIKASNSISISILSDFWIKVTRLPMSYFETHHVGDTMQRIGDNRLIQGFLTGTSIGTLFSFLTFIVFAVVLILYQVSIFMVFAIGNILYVLWVMLFLRIRRKLNYESFYISAKETSLTMQLVHGIRELKLNNAEQQKRWEWENIQANIFKLGFKSLNYGQIQHTGAFFINSLKNLFISYYVARMVVDGSLTLGQMVSIQYIIGQVEGPIGSFIGFVQSLQDARISAERLDEIHQYAEEEQQDNSFRYELQQNKSIEFKELSFSYPGNTEKKVLDNISFTIPEGRVTAIVGVSGSGKTTLLKILLKFYTSFTGDIKVGGLDFKTVSPSFWRSSCGAVLQDGYIFSDTIARNIALGDEEIDRERLLEACRIANILSFIDSLPNGFNTKLGSEGIGVSQGQQQRLLIARAVYKNPLYLFLDEATNALDANNEKAIVDNLSEFYENRTVVVVAHRLSTVKHAHKIIVLADGRVVEEGNHHELCRLKGKYFELVQNQLELGN